MNPTERKSKLLQILELLQDSGYLYDKSKSGVDGKTEMPPPRRTQMNCESAARIFMQLALDMNIDKLQAVYFVATLARAWCFIAISTFWRT